MSRKYQLPIRYTGILVELMKSKWGIEPKLVLEGTSISPHVIHDDNEWLNYADFTKACDNAIALCPDPDLGFYFGEQMVLPAHGIWGLAVLTSPTIAAGSQYMKTYVTGCLPFFEFQFRCEEQYAYFTAGENKLTQWNRPYVLEFVNIAAAINYAYALEGIEHLEVFFAYPKPSYADKYYELLGNNVYFDADFTGLRFPAELVDKKMPDADHATLMVLRSMLVSRGKALKPITVADQIENYFNINPGVYPSQNELADAINLSPRALRYKLSSDGLSFKELIEARKKSDASRYLELNVPINQISDLLGYRDAANFTRAFKRWFGRSPLQFSKMENLL